MVSLAVCGLARRETKTLRGAGQGPMFTAGALLTALMSSAVSCDCDAYGTGYGPGTVSGGERPGTGIGTGTGTSPRPWGTGTGTGTAGLSRSFR